MKGSSLLQRYRILNVSYIKYKKTKASCLPGCKELTQTLEMLRDAKVLLELGCKDGIQRDVVYIVLVCELNCRETNSRLAIEVVKLEQEKVIIDTERFAAHGGRHRHVKLQVQNVERDKSKLASEIEELNQWLHRPAAEKRQLVTKLDEVMQMLHRLQVDNSQLQLEMEMAGLVKSSSLVQELGGRDLYLESLCLHVGGGEGKLETRQQSWMK
ncbi:unnamed protein product [Sphagnum balticum]